MPPFLPKGSINSNIKTAKYKRNSTDIKSIINNGIKVFINNRE